MTFASSRGGASVRKSICTAAALVALTGVATAASAQERLPVPTGRMSILYAAQDEVRAIAGPGLGPAITGDRGALRQDPGIGGMLDAQGRDDRFRMGKVSDHDLESLDAEGMADRIQRESDDPRVPNSTGLVAIDEVGNSFNDGRVRTTYRWVTVRGKKIRVASHNRIVVTAKGWRLVRGAAALPTVRAESLGSRLSAAMQILAQRPHPAGGTYADRVHIYVAPAFSTSIAEGRGPHRHLGNDGKPHRATWRGVMPALSLAGGVWLQMYHFKGRTLSTMSTKLWRTVPADFTAYGGRFGLRPERLHFMLSGATNRPAGSRASCGDAMACQWALARGTAAGRAVLANGPGAYATGSLSTAWRREFNRHFAD